jgi:D-alanyl-D-alanine carboxypeptidase
VQGLSIRGRRLGLVVLLSLCISACSTTGGTAPPIPTAHVAGVFLPATAAPPTIAVSPTETIPTATIASATPTDEPTPTTPSTSTPEPSPTEVALEPFDPALAARLQQILDAAVADGYIPGVVLAVQIPDQAPWAGASGLADRRQQLPMEPNTRVRIASISKVFTAVVVLQLVEEGRIALDAPMTTWLPDLVPNGEAITVRNLLNHTTGLYDFVEDRNFIGKGYQNPDRVWEPRELVAYATQHHPAFAPGAENRWDYSSTNYVILGMIVEQVTGNTLATEMRQRIFAPLELESTFFVPEEEVQGTQARGYSHGTDQTDISLSIVFATANIVSTASDVQRFARAIVEGELLQPATQEILYRFVDGKGQYNMPDLAYGEGIMLNRLPVGPSADGQKRPAEASTVVGHIGGFGGFRSAMWATPESGISIALAVNQAASDPNILATRVFDAILDYQGR